MVTEKMIANARHMQRELAWFAEVVQARLDLYFGKETDKQEIFDITPPDFDTEDSIYASFVAHYKLSFAERITLLLALMPHMRPELLDVFFLKNGRYERGFTEFGGVRGENHGGFLPTGETAIFVLAGHNLEARFSLYHLFGPDHFFAGHNILRLESVSNDEPGLSGVLKISREFLDLFTTGEAHKPNFSADFPARHITTNLDWEDLVLDPNTIRSINEIRAWIDHGATLLNDWGLGKKLRPGYRSLFYGPPGTGKTMTACLLGKSTNRDVYRIDLSMVVSKYIGETEKNLEKVFAQAEHKNWILFFDEADALFGKRTGVEDSHDRYANQEVSFLLQRIETFDGIVILASNLKSNIDEAFTRRFESIINFPMPKPDERFKIWMAGFSEASRLDERINLRRIAADYELSGGAIMNVVRYASLMALNRESDTIMEDELKEGIKKEYIKEGKTL